MIERTIGFDEVRRHLVCARFRRVSRIETGIGSFFYIYFQCEDGESSVESMKLWICCCYWKVRKDGKEILHAENNRSEIAGTLRCLEGKTFIEVLDASCDFHSELRFSGGITLTIYHGRYRSDDEMWVFFDKNVAVVAFEKAYMLQLE